MKVRTRPLLLAAALLAGTVVPLAAPAAADTGPVPLEMTTVGDVVVDDAHGRLFVSGGPQGDGIRVTDLSGALVATLAFRGAAGMALSPDGSDLWVALPEFGLVQIDTATLTAERRVDLPAEQCPGDVALSGDRVAYGYSCHQYGATGGGYGGIGLVDATTGTPLGTTTSGPFYRPVVEAGPDGTIYAADGGLSPTGLYVYDVSGSAPGLRASRAEVCSNLRDLSAAPLGDQVVTACGGTYQHEVWSLGLDRVGDYFSGAYPVAGAWSADGSSFAAGLASPYEPDLYVYRAGQGSAEQAVREVDFGSTTSLLEPGALAASKDGSRVWAVASSGSGGLALHVIDVPLPDSSSLSVAAEPTAFYAGQPTRLTGRLAAVTGAPVPGATLSVTRMATGAAPSPLEPVTTASDGTFALVDTPPHAGSWSYTVSHPADAAVASTTVLAWATDTRLTLAVEPDGAGVHGTLSLRFDGPDTGAGRSVTLTRAGDGAVTALQPVLLDAYGAGKFLDGPGPGTWTYTASVAADGVHPAASASGTVSLASATTLTAGAPASAAAGTPVTVTGTLTAAAGPVTGATVTVRRAGCDTTAWTLSGVTTPNGAWSVTDPAPPVGTCTYSASFAGDSSYAASTASTSTTVSLRPTTLTAAAPDTATAGAAVAVTGTLTSGSDAVAGALVTVSRSGCSSWAGTATTLADGSWSVDDPVVPAGTCTWVASYAGSSTTAKASSTPATTTVAFQATSLGLSVVRGTGSAKKQVVVTAQLTSGSSNRTVTLTAQPSGGAEVVLVRGDVDSTGKLSAAYTPKRTTTYRARYAGDAFFAPATAQEVQ